MAAPTDFRQHLEVETPEHVLLDYEIAGIGSRTLAALADLFILGIAFFAGLIVAAYLTATLSGAAWVMAAGVVLSFLATWGYFTFFEALWGGQTPGKRWLGIRVVRDTGHPVTFGAAAARNLLRLADFLPAGYLLGGLCAAIHPRGKRLGDLVAGTVVVRDQPMIAAALPSPAGEGEEVEGIPELDDEEFLALGAFVERAGQLEPEVRVRLATQLAETFTARYPPLPTDPATFLARLYQEERARRRGRFGARRARGPRLATAGGRTVAERLAVRQGIRWNEFQALADRASRSGLDSFQARELPDFAARYREIAADLARAHTYQASPAILQRLERLVAAGHNLLYRDERQPARRVAEFLLRECPGAVVAAWRVVALAGLVFTLSAGAGFVLLRQQPELAEEVLPATMLERAEAGAARVEEGRGYFEAEAELQPLIASSIMTNNIRVAFACFAWGIFLGVGSLWALAYNGLALGTASGHFANRRLLGYLWTFIAGHGVLELFAIWVAGGAGFLLGRALIAPGELPRGEALVLAGRSGLPLVGAMIVLLVIAGLIEGFVSAGSTPLPLRLAVSTGSLLCLALWLANGRAWVTRKTLADGNSPTPRPAEAR